MCSQAPIMSDLRYHRITLEVLGISVFIHPMRHIIITFKCTRLQHFIRLRTHQIMILPWSWLEVGQWLRIQQPRWFSITKVAILYVSPIRHMPSQIVISLFSVRITFLIFSCTAWSTKECWVKKKEQRLNSRLSVFQNNLIIHIV